MSLCEPYILHHQRMMALGSTTRLFLGLTSDQAYMLSQVQSEPHTISLHLQHPYSLQISLSNWHPLLATPHHALFSKRLFYGNDLCVAFSSQISREDPATSSGGAMDTHGSVISVRVIERKN